MQHLSHPLQQHLLKLVQKESYAELGFSNDGRLLKVESSPKPKLIPGLYNFIKDSVIQFKP